MTQQPMTPQLEEFTAKMAKAGLKPLRFMSGMVIGPSTMTLATALPEMVPNRLELTTDTLPGPPAVWPVIASAKSMNNLPMPDFSMKLPNNTKTIT